MSKVYVMQATKFQADVSPAAHYGEIQFVLAPGDRTSSNPELSLRKLLTWADKFNPKEDFVLWSGGDPLSAMLTGVALFGTGVEKFTFLRYEKNRGNGGSPGYYVPVVVDFREHDALWEPMEVETVEGDKITLQD